MSTATALTGRKFVANENVATVGKRFSVVQYNILADRAVPKEGGGHDICGTYAYCPASHRYMDSRHQRIMAELAEHDADVVCLQEVEAGHYYDCLKPELAKLGYGGVVHQRWYDHIGLAIFYRKAAFDLEEEHSLLLHTALSSLPYSSLAASTAAALEKYVSLVTTLPQFGLQPQGFVMAKLRHRSSGRLIAVGNVHVFWGNMEYKCTQILQIACAWSELLKFAGDDCVPVILAGDFNTEPGTPAYEYLARGSLSQEAVSKLLAEPQEKNVIVDGKKLVDIVGKHLPPHYHLTSSYKTVMGKEPAITSADDSAVLGRTKPFYGCLDYVWYDDRRLVATGVLPTPGVDVIAEHYALPSIAHPSDHLSLKAEFAFVP